MNIHSQRKGIALIAVLGFLSILVLLAVAFLMNMRTERLVAETAKDDVQARQLLHGAMAAAMDDLNNIMAKQDLTTGGPSAAKPPVNIRLPKSRVILSSWEALNTNYLKNDSVRLISGEVTNWIPRRYLSPTDPDFDAVAIASNANWILIKDRHPVCYPTNRLLGRFGYVALDCTGQIDANLAGTNQRATGVSMAEIKMESLPEVRGSLGATNLYLNRTNFCRFGTFPEILFLNADTNASLGQKYALLLPLVNNLAPYSLCYDNGWWDWTSSSWTNYAYGAPLDITTWTSNDAYNVFTSLGYANPGEMAACFVDYIDGDFLPGTSNGIANPNIVCGESIPMINEVAVGAELSLIGKTLTYTHVFEVELWFPFPAEMNNNHSYTVNFHPYLYTNSARAGSKIIELALSSSPMTEKPCVPSFKPDPTRPFTVVTARYDFVYLFAEAPTDFPIKVRAKEIVVTNLTLIDDTVGPPQVVDRANLLGSAGPFDVYLSSLSTTFYETNHIRVAAVIDPRLNHLTSEWDIPQYTTMGSMNVMATNKTVGMSIISHDFEGRTCYVANRSMSNVAELGFIPIGGTNQWTTIDLFSPKGRELLAKFRTTNITAGTKSTTNGLLNPNTSYIDVITAAFYGAPIEEYPGDPSAVKVGLPMAGLIATNFMAVSTNLAITATNTFDSAAGWVTIPAFAVNGDLVKKNDYTNMPYYMNNNKKESIIRNTYRLFNPNQNLFTIVVIAQAINDQPDGAGNYGTFGKEDTIIGEKRAVALVWRDPFPDPATGRHEMFVRTFKYLNE